MTPNTETKSRSRPLTGKEYLASLQDDREIWIYGERVRNVTTHPAFRNTARMIARLYDALHGDRRSILCTQTDTGSAGFTHKFFKLPRSADEMVDARNAIVEWARMTYGWMGRTPDYKASFLATMGPQAEFYAPFDQNARRWYKRFQEEVTFVNHAFVNPPVDRNKELSEVRDIYLHVEKETDKGLIMSGAKVVATSSALTHYTFVGNNNTPLPIKTRDFAFLCMVPSGAPGVKFLCRASYEMGAAVMGSPFDYPLSSRFDENDSIVVFDKVLVPWENVLAYGDIDKINNFFADSGFLARYMFHGCTRLAVKLDFMAGLLLKGVGATGTGAFRGVEAQVGELIAWRSIFWGLTDAMARAPTPWTRGYLLPNLEYGLAYQVAVSHVYPRLREIVENVLASALIYTPSSTADFKHPVMRKYFDRYLRGSNGYSAIERTKLMKLIWDAFGSEFGSRHELYERNYFGSHETIRVLVADMAEKSGSAAAYKGFVEQCMAEYSLDGWTAADLWNCDDVSVTPHGA